MLEGVSSTGRGWEEEAVDARGGEKHRGCGVFTGSDRTERFAVGSGDVFSNRRGCYPAAVRSQRRCDGSAESIAGGISVPFRRLVDASSGVGRK